MTLTSGSRMSAISNNTGHAAECGFRRRTKTRWYYTLQLGNPWLYLEQYARRMGSSLPF